jgi:hypothetical protein
MKLYILYLGTAFFIICNSLQAQTKATQKPVSKQVNAQTATTTSQVKSQQPKPSLSSATDSLKWAVNDFKSSMNKLFGGRKDTLSILVSNVDYDDQNLTSLKDEIRKVKGVKFIDMQYKGTIARINLSFKGKSTELWDQLPVDTRKPFRMIEAGDNVISVGYKLKTAGQ